MVVSLVQEGDIIDFIGDVHSSSPWGVKNSPSASLNNTVVRNMKHLILSDDSDGGWAFLSKSLLI